MNEEIIPTNGTSAEDVKYAKRVEKIYIDGVDVAECEFYIADDKHFCDLSFINKEELRNCDNINDCYYKQLKRLEQENKALKDNINHLQAIIDDGRAENKRFREENKELKELNKKICEDWEKEIKVYWNTLKEIRIIAGQRFVSGLNEEADAYNNDMDEIENKIDEVLNG
jgi:predicted RNase H-like nuclease (RuvC/YqgF family)